MSRLRRFWGWLWGDIAAPRALVIVFYAWAVTNVIDGIIWVLR